MDNLPDPEHQRAVGHDAVTIALAALWGFSIAIPAHADMLLPGALVMLFVIITIVEKRFLDPRGGRYAVLRLITGLAVLGFVVRSYLNIGASSVS